MSRRFALAVCTAAITIATTTAVLHGAGWRINTSPSVPVGLWLLEQPAGIGRGQVVAICPPASPPFLEARARGYFVDGDCSSGTEPLLKPIAAVAGDTVEVTGRAVVVNGQPLANSAPLAADGAGRPMPAVRHVHQVPAGMVWVVSSHHAGSFDSRYFGPLPVSAIQAAARPVWVRP